MKCPLTSIGYLASNRMNASRKCECGKEKCAWWESHGGFCSVLKISRHMEDIGIALEAIETRLFESGGK